MRYLLLLWSIMLAGCGFTPERGNPYDPNSDQYIPPPVLNRPPSVERPSVTTRCVNNPVLAPCAVAVRARVTDPDNNLNLDSVVVLVNGRFFGELSYEPDTASWALTREESELDSATDRYVGSWVTVVAYDDSGATHRDSSLFPNLYREYPTIRYPEDSGGANGDCVCPDYHTFSWDRWNGEGHPRDLELRFYFQNNSYISDLTVSSISPADTSLEVPLNFWTADNNSFIFYGWRVFVRDESGSEAGSLSGTFRSFENCPEHGCEP